jgi:hypothetical protein
MIIKDFLLHIWMITILATNKNSEEMKGRPNLANISPHKKSFQQEWLG